jgi:hypothetical protein
MKVDSDVNVLERSGVVGRISCTISVNKHSFSLLARQYKDPIKAILQELGSNAVDSHVRAGNNNPFTISLPGVLSNQFRIRDYGTGMSKDVIENVYTQWMNSDKRNSDTEIGCFGIGSKTPLAYTSSFNITSYVDGLKSMYSLCFNETGIPELQHYGDFQTDEANGVEISFAVKNEDFSRFSNSANSVYNYFNIKPLIDGVLPTKQLQTLSSGDRWKIYGLEDYYASRIVFVMGGVAYPMDSSYYFKSKFGSIRNHQIAIEVPIGSLDITPSRESLEITPKTTKTVNEELVRVYDEISKNLVVEVDSIDQSISDWSYYLEMRRVFKKYSDLGYDETYMKSRNYARKVRFYPAKVSSDIVQYMGTFSNSNRNRVSRIDYEKDSLTFNPDSAGVEYVVLNDVMDSKMLRKIKHYVRSKDCTLTLFSYVGGHGVDDVLDAIGANSDEVNIFNSSELPEVPRQSRKPGTYTRLPKEIASVKRFIVKDRRCSPSEHWDNESTKIDISTGEYYYCKVSRNYPETFSNDSLNQFSKYLGISIINFGVVPKKIKNFPNVKNLDDADVVEGLLLDWVEDNPNEIEDYRIQKFFSDKFDIGSKYNNSGAWHIINNLEKIDEKFGEDHCLAKFQKYTSVCSKDISWMRYLESKGVLKTEFDFSDLSVQFGKNLEKYNGISGTKEDIIRLVNMVDSFDNK